MLRKSRKYKNKTNLRAAPSGMSCFTNTSTTLTSFRLSLSLAAGLPIFLSLLPGDGTRQCCVGQREWKPLSRVVQVFSPALRQKLSNRSFSSGLKPQNFFQIYGRTKYFLFLLFRSIFPFRRIFISVDLMITNLRIFFFTHVHRFQIY